MDIRVGNGYDTHPLINGSALILGGVSIPHNKKKPPNGGNY